MPWARNAAVALSSAIIATTGVAGAIGEPAVVEVTVTGGSAAPATVTPRDVARPAMASVTEHPVDPAVMAAVARRPGQANQVVQVIRLVVRRGPGHGHSPPCPNAHPRRC